MGSKIFAGVVFLSVLLAAGCTAPEPPMPPLPPARTPTDTEVAWHAMLYPDSGAGAAELAASPVWQAQARLDDWGGQTQLLAEAKRFLDHALAADPDDPYAKVQLARYAVMSGDLGGNGGTVRILNEVIATHPDFAEAYVLKGHAMTNSGQMPAAATALDRAAELGATSPWLELNRAALFQATGGGERAVPLCNAVIERRVPSSKAMITAYQCRAQHLFNQRDYATIESDYLASLALRPGDPFTLINYAEFLCFQRGRCTEAAEPLQEALAAGDRGVIRRIDAAIRYDAWAQRVAADGIDSPQAESAFAEAQAAQPDLEEAMAHYGGRFGGSAVVEALAAKGVDVDVFDASETTALMHAGMYGDPELAGTLLALGASPTLLDDQEWSALMYSARAGDLDVVKLLAAAAQDDPQGEEQLASGAKIAEHYGHAEVAAYLEAAAADGP